MRDFVRIRKDGKIKILFREDFPERIQIDLVTTIQERESVKMVSPVKSMQLEGSLQWGVVFVTRLKPQGHYGGSSAPQTQLPVCSHLLGSAEC